MIHRVSRRELRRALRRSRCDRRLRHRRRAIRKSDPHRPRHGVDRAARPQRQVGAARHADLGGDRQCQGRAARPAGQARLLRRPEQSLERAGALHQAARRRQGRPHHRRLCHQHDRAGAAGRDRAQQGVHRPDRARDQRRVRLPALFRDAPGRPEPEGRDHPRLLRDRDGADAEAADGGDRRDRRRVLAQRLRRRAGERQGGRAQNRPRPQLPAQHHRLRTDRARDAGEQRRPRGRLLLSAGDGRHHPRPSTRSATSRR